MKDSMAWVGSKVSTLLLFLIVCLPLIFCYMACVLLYVPFYLGIETCTLNIDNQSGKTLRLTAIDPNGISPYVQIYSTSWPQLPIFQQRSFTVKSGDLRTLTYDCSHHGTLEMYACDLGGECYVNKDHLFLSQRGKGNEDIVSFNGFKFTSLESLPRPDQAMITIVQSLPEHDYSGLKYILLGFIFVIALLFWFFRVRRARRLGRST